MKILSFLSLLFIYSQVQAQDKRWVFFETDNEGTYYYDIESMRYDISFNMYTIWVKYIYSPKKYNTSKNKYIEYELLKWKLFCNSRQLKEEDLYQYYDDESYDIQTINELYSIPPESIGESLYNKICK
jgi:hypothetical protein